MLACNCPILFLAQNDNKSIGNLNYSWRQVSILHLRVMENNILSVATDPSFVSVSPGFDVWLMARVKKLPTLAPLCCDKKCSTCISPYYASNYTFR